MKVILYEHGCPKCIVLKTKLDQKHISYELVNDVELMKSKGLTFPPYLEVDGVVMKLKEAVDWIKEQ